MEILTFYKIPVGWLFNTIVVWLKSHAAWLFNFIGFSFANCLEKTLDFLLHPSSMVVVMLVMAWALQRFWYRRAIVIIVFLSLLLIDYIFFPNHRPLEIIGLLVALVLYIFMRRTWNVSVQRLMIAGVVAAFGIIDWMWLEPLWPLQFVLIALLALIAWFVQERWSIVILTIAGFLFVINQGYWRDTMETMALLIWSGILCMGIGVPLGIVGAHRPRFYRIIQPILDLMQTLPAFVYLIPAVFFFRIGMVPGLIATVIFVLPAPIRLTEIGIRSTPKTLLEVGQAFGANRWRLLWKVELPYALPQIRASMTQTIMLSLSMVVIAATVGGSGLGVKVYRALQTGNAALGFEAGCVIVIVAIVLDRIFRPGKGR